MKQTNTITTVVMAFNNSNMDFVPSNYLEKGRVLINARTDEKYTVLIHRFAFTCAGIGGMPIQLVLDKHPQMFDILDTSDGKIHLYVSSVKEETSIIW
jgi:hypothetical protein